MRPMKLADFTIVHDTGYDGDRSHQSKALLVYVVASASANGHAQRDWAAGRTLALQAREGLQETRLPFKCRWEWIWWGRSGLLCQPGPVHKKREGATSLHLLRQVTSIHDTTIATLDSNFPFQSHIQHTPTFDIASLVVSRT